MEKVIKKNKKADLAIKLKPNTTFIPSDKSKFWVKIFVSGFKSLVLKNFFSMRVKGKENFDLRDKNCATLFFGSHKCWWDGIVGYLTCCDLLSTNFHIMIEELYRFPLLARIGAFSVDKNSAYSSLKSLNYGVNLLKNSNNSVWIFPQGVVKPPHYNTIEFAKGLAYMAKKAGRLNIVPIAHTYEFLRQEKPEILVDIGKPIIVNNNVSDLDFFTKEMEKELSILLKKQKEAISTENLCNYDFYIRSNKGKIKILEKYLCKFFRKFYV